MLRHRSIIKVADNSGALELMLIGIPGRGEKKFAEAGDVITAVVKKAQPFAQARKSQIVKAVIIRTRRSIRRPDGTYIKFSDNAAVLIDGTGNLLGTRISGPVAAEVRKTGFTKIVSTAAEVY